MTEEIHRLEIMVRDKDVGKVQRLLAGHVLDLKSQPVVNAKFGKNGVRAVTSGNICEMFLEHVIKNKVAMLTPQEIDVWCMANNRPSKSARYSVIACGKKAGYLKKRGRGKFIEYVIDLSKAKKARG
jgi:hypothetical protein